MAFADNLKKLDALRLQQQVKATVQYNGRLSFTLEAGKTMGLSEEKSIIIFEAQNGDLGATISAKGDPEAFVLKKCGPYFYLALHNYLKQAGIDYKRQKIIYDISPLDEKIEGRTLFKFERRFIHDPKSGTTLNEWGVLFSTVYGINAIAGLAFYVAALFRDHIYNREGFFPIYNIFGVRGSGKTEMANSMMQLFGHHEVDVSIKTATLPSLADHVSRTSNALCHIDEYKNDLEYDKLEFLKGLWNSIGRSRMNMDKDKKKETTAVNCGVILTGQDMPTADNALFTRVIFTRFSKTGFTEEEGVLFNRLKTMEKKGVTGITNEIIMRREEFLKLYDANRNQVYEDMGRMEKKGEYEDRIWRGWAILINAVKTLSTLFRIDIGYDYALRELCGMMKTQQTEARTENDVAVFWRMVSVLAKNGDIEDGYDYIVKTGFHFKFEKLEINREKGDPVKVLAIELDRCVSLYRQLAKKEGVKTILDKGTLEYYLVNSPEYIGRWPKRMKKRVDKLQESSAQVNPANGDIKVQTYVPRLFAFDYNRVGIDIDTEWEAKNEI